MDEAPSRSSPVLLVLALQQQSRQPPLRVTGRYAQRSGFKPAFVLRARCLGVSFAASGKGRASTITSHRLPRVSTRLLYWVVMCNMCDRSASFSSRSAHPPLGRAYRETARRPMRGRALAMLCAAQPCTISSCPRASAEVGITTVITVDGIGNGTVRAAARQPSGLAQPMQWLPAPSIGRGGGQGPEATLAHVGVGQPLRQFSSSAGGSKPSLKTQIRELYKLVHPDRFQDHPVAQVRWRRNKQDVRVLTAQRPDFKLYGALQTANTKSFKMLQEYLAAANKVTIASLSHAPVLTARCAALLPSPIKLCA